MKDEQKKQSNYLLVFVIVPVIVIALVVAAVFLIAYRFDKDEFEATDTRGDDVLETGFLIDSPGETKIPFAGQPCELAATDFYAQFSQVLL